MACHMPFNLIKSPNLNLAAKCYSIVGAEYNFKWLRIKIYEAIVMYKVPLGRGYVQGARKQITSPRKIITLPPPFHINIMHVTSRTRLSPFSACNIEKWVWPGNEATYHAHLYLFVHTHLHTLTHTLTPAHTHTHTHLPTHTHTHTCPHTHTHTPPPPPQLMATVF